MRSFVLKSSSVRFLTLKSVATMSLLALVGSGCGSEAGSNENEDEDVDQVMAQLAGAGGSPGTSAVISVASATPPDPDGSAVSTTSSGGSLNAGGPTAFWKFDDCQANSTVLQDFSGNNAVAIRSLSTSCAEGIDGAAISFDQKKDGIEAPSHPSFALKNNIAVAAWVKPTTVGGTHTIVQKSTPSGLAFSLSIVKGDAIMKVSLTSVKTVTAHAPVSANKWTHVAGLYNGTSLFLFVNGQQVGQIAAAGTIKDVSAPIHIGTGKNGNTQGFSGLIDEVWLSTNPVTPSEVEALSCVVRQPTLTITPLTSGVVQPDTTVTYDVSIKNNNVGTCGPAAYAIQNFGQPAGFNIFPDPFVTPDVASGETGTFSVSVTGTSLAEPGVHQIPFDILDFNAFTTFVSGQLTYELAEPTGCFVRTNRELISKSVSVVDDPIRTTFNGPASDPRTGAWTFGKLIENMAPTPADAPALATQLFSTWLSNQTVNGFTVPARPFMQSQVLDSWPKNPNGTLDLKKAPLRLLAIVNRMDLRNLAAGNAGEGRFVFGVEGQKGDPLQFTVILEYNLPASSEAEILDWASSWHALGSLPFPSEDYNNALQTLTTKFTGRNAAPGRPNGSALSQLRTNEIALSFPWELREFTLSPSTGFLRETTVKLTPDQNFDQSQTLANFVNANAADIIQEKHTVPELFAGNPFLGGSSFNNLNAWSAPGIIDNEARHHFSLNTCNGCHGAAETGTGFLHIFPRSPAQESQLSGFMTGTTVSDPVTLQPRSFNDLGRRKVDLEGLVCASSPAAPGSKAAAQGRTVSIAKGISRVH